MRATPWERPGHHPLRRDEVRTEPPGQYPSVYPGAALQTGDYLVVMGGSPVTAVGLHLDPQGSRVEPAWVLERPYQRCLPYVISAGEGRVYLASGSFRLLVAADAGTVLAEASAPAPPSSLPAVSGSDLLVPEGDELAAYDATTLEPRWRRATPRGLRAGPVAAGLCPLVPSKDPENVALWDIHTDAVSEIAGCTYLERWSAPLLLESLVVVSCGQGGGDRLVAIGRDTGAVAWEAETPPPSPNFFKAPAGTAPHVGPSTVPHGERLVSVNQIPSVEARVTATGELVWRHELADPGVRTSPGIEQPTAVAVIDATVWVGTQNMRVLALDAADGTFRGDAALTTVEGASSIFPMPGAGAPSAALAIGNLGTIYGLAI